MNAAYVNTIREKLLQANIRLYSSERVRFFDPPLQPEGQPPVIARYRYSSRLIRTHRAANNLISSSFSYFANNPGDVDCALVVATTLLDRLRLESFPHWRALHAQYPAATPSQWQNLLTAHAAVQMVCGRVLYHELRALTVAALAGEEQPVD